VEGFNKEPVIPEIPETRPIDNKRNDAAQPIITPPIIAITN
jgi:hypothetical protein